MSFYLQTTWAKVSHCLLVVFTVEYDIASVMQFIFQLGLHLKPGSESETKSDTDRPR